MDNNKKNTSTELADKYTRFRTHLKRGWINVELHFQIKLLLEEKCKDKEYADSVVVNSKSPVGKDNQENIRLRGSSLLGFVDSKKGAGTEWALEWTLAGSIALFEAFVSDTAAIIYMIDPEKYLLVSSDQGTSQRDNYKVSEIIIKSESREKALERMVEEKLRGIFYGSPIEAFIKYNSKSGHKDGKLRFQLNNILHDNCHQELLLYEEMVGRRNAIVHHAGIIDTKYIRDVSDISSKLNLNDKVKINEDYLFSSLKAMDRIATYYINQLSDIAGVGKKPKSAKL